MSISLPMRIWLRGWVSLILLEDIVLEVIVSSERLRMYLQETSGQLVVLLSWIVNLGSFVYDVYRSFSDNFIIIIIISSSSNSSSSSSS